MLMTFLILMAFLTLIFFWFFVSQGNGNLLYPRIHQYPHAPQCTGPMLCNRASTSRRSGIAGVVPIRVTDSAAAALA